MTKLGLFILALISLRAFALETDNYLMWDRTLEDSSPLINDFLTTEISQALQQTEKLSCPSLTHHVAGHFRSWFVHDNPVENGIFGHLDKNQVYPQTFDYVGMSIYRNPYHFYLPAIGLAPNIMVRGIYFGMDKLSHFASTGHDYYVVQQNLLKLGFDLKAATQTAIYYGATDERAVHGYWSSGVFSYADLEANFRGLLFWEDLCGGLHPLVKKVQGQWQLQRRVKIENYVTPLWDESYNPSYFLPGNWKKISPFLKTYCEKAKSPLVMKRKATYALRMVRSPSFEFLLDLINEKKLPTPQSFTELCK